MRNTGLEEAQAGIEIARRNINNLRYADDTTFMAESEEELKSLLMKVKEESKKVGLKLNIQKNKIMASGPITSWQIDGKTMETLTDFIFLGSKVTATKLRGLLLGRKAMINLDSVLKSRDITLPTKVPMGHLARSEDSAGCHPGVRCGRGGTITLRVETKDATRHPTAQGTTPSPAKDEPTQNVSKAKAEKLCSRRSTHRVKDNNTS